MKQRLKTITSTLKFETQGHALPPNARQVYQQAEANFTTSDRTFLDMKEARNDLEAFSYEFREALGENGKFLKNCLPEVSGPFFAELSETVEWLYGAGENAPLEELQTRLNKFRGLGVPIKSRHIFYELVEEHFRVFEDTCKKTKQKLAGSEPYGFEERQKQIVAKVNVTQEFMTALRIEIDEKPKSQDCSVTLIQVE